MLFGELKNRVLQLAFNYSLAGTPIPSTYNNQADYLAMIPGLVNEAQMDIAISHKRIAASKALSDMTSTLSGGFDKYSWPSDCWQPFSNGLLDPLTLMRFPAVRYMPDCFYVPSGTPGTYLFEYWRYPEAVSSATADATELDNTPDVHECLPYYVACGLLLYDDAYRAQEMRNEFLLRISKLREPLWLEPQPIINRYFGEY
ncbi:MAG: hypothetical protein Q4F31_09335 [Eubacteriales bacterium]|nr:hypothetical protein [Eubacteriales bacterium]